jgi:hypothetical protein
MHNKKFAKSLKLVEEKENKDSKIEEDLETLKKVPL